jgi:hypothetical protein
LEENKNRAIAELLQLQQLLSLGQPHPKLKATGLATATTISALSSISIFEPIHQSSGTELALIDSNASLYSPKHYLNQENAEGNTDSELWGYHDPSMNMIERERRLREAQLRALLPPEENLEPVVETKKKTKQEEREIYLLVKCINLLFTKKFDFSAITGEVVRPMPTFIKIRNRVLKKNTGFNSLVRLVIDSAFPGSLTKRKLRSLGRYVAGNTYRKVMISWNYVENRYEKTAYKKVVMERDANGLVHPVKYGALKLSTLTGLLCSYKVRLAHSELFNIYGKFGFTDRADMIHSLRLAAVRLLLGPNNGAGMGLAEELKTHLKDLVAERGEQLVTKLELAKIVFPEDDEEREKELLALEADREQLEQTLLEEKRKKEVMVERIEQRRIKTSKDFEANFRTIHTIKGASTTLDPKRHSALRDLMEFCKQNLAKKHAAKDIHLPPLAVELIGLEHFPQFMHEDIKQSEKGIEEEAAPVRAVLTSVSKAASRPPSQPTTARRVSGASGHHSGATTRRLSREELFNRFDGGFRIKIQGPPPLVRVLHETVALGRGLNGLSQRDAVMLMQAYGSTRIQAFYRGYCRRWRFFYAKRLWGKYFDSIQRRTLQGWAKVVRHDVDTRRYCWRKVKMWRQYAADARRRRRLFCACFWPFYVWRRWSTATALAKEKSKFLTTKVMPTILEIRIFRAWKEYTKCERDLMKRACAHDSFRNHAKMRISLRWLKRWTEQRRVLRKLWFGAGLSQLKKNLFIRKNTPFQIWHAYVHLKKQIRGRVRTQISTFKGTFAMGLPHVVPQSIFVRRIKMKELSAINRAEDEKMKTELAAKKLKRLQDRSKGHDGGDDGNSNSSSKNTGRDTGAAGTGEGADTPGGDPNLDAPNSSSRPGTAEDNGSKPGTADGNDGADASEKPKEKKRGAGVQLVASKKLEQPKWRAGGSTALTALLHRLGRIAKPGFVWSLAKKDVDIDIDIDDDEFKQIPKDIRKLYEKVIAPLPYAEDLTFLNWMDSYTSDKINIMRKNFTYAEMWSLMEYTGRFLIFACRAFRNWRTYAKVRKNEKVARKKYGLKMKRLVFSSLLKWIKPMDMEKPVDGKPLSEAELLANVVRSARLTKMYRRRQAYLEVMALGRDYFDNEGELDEEAEERRVKAKYERLKAQKVEEAKSMMSGQKQKLLARMASIKDDDDDDDDFFDSEEKKKQKSEAVAAAAEEAKKARYVVRMNELIFLFLPLKFYI